MAGPRADGSDAEVELDLVEHPVVARLTSTGSLASKVQRGVVWSVSTRALLVLVQLGSTAVLARLLLPEAFGLVALALVVNRLAALLASLGLSQAVVQSRVVTERLLSSVFWLNALVGLVVTVALVGIAPVVAGAYGEPRLAGLLQVSALAFVLDVTVVPMALLQRSFQFRRVSEAEVVATVSGVAVTVALALAGAGAYSLVVGPVAQVVVYDVALCAVVRWWPRTFLHRRELGELWRYGRGLTGSNLLYFVGRNTDTVLLGQAVSLTQLGLYNRAYNVMLLPLTQVTHVLTRVLLPAFAQLQDDLPRLRRAWLTTVRTSLAVGLPAGFGVAAAAPAVVETLYGPRWLGAVPVLVLLAASVPTQLISRNTGPVYQALGRTGQQFRIAVVSTAVTVGGIVVGLRWGIEGVAAAYLVTSAISLVLGMVPLLRLVGLSVGELWRAVRSLLLAGALMAGAAHGTGLLADGLPAPAVLGVQVAAGGVVYAAGLWLFDRDLLRPVVQRLPVGRRRRP